MTKEEKLNVDLWKINNETDVIIERLKEFRLKHTKHMRSKDYKVIVVR